MHGVRCRTFENLTIFAAFISGFGNYPRRHFSHGVARNSFSFLVRYSLLMNRANETNKIMRTAWREECRIDIRITTILWRLSRFHHLSFIERIVRSQPPLLPRPESKRSVSGAMVFLEPSNLSWYFCLALISGHKIHNTRHQQARVHCGRAPSMQI